MEFEKGHHWCRHRVKGCGFRMTIGRDAVLDVLSSTEDHLSAEDIYMRVHETYPAIGLTSVYRTLDMLVNIGLVYKFDFGDGRSRFEIAEGPKGKDHHHHLVCTACNEFIDISDALSGHEICTPEPHVNAIYLNAFNSEQTHPNKVGQDDMAAAVFDGLVRAGLIRG